MMTTIVSAKASTKTALTDFLSVPKIIGIGPIIITPAAFTFPFPARNRSQNNRCNNNHDSDNN